MDPQKSLESLPHRILELKGNQTTVSFSRFLGVGVSTLHNYEKGRVPPLEFLLLLAQKTGVSLQWLLTGESSKYRDGEDGTNMEAVQMSILVVDDKEYQRESIVNLLEAEGYVCVQAGNLVEAQERLASETIDIVVTDLRMPNEDDGLVLLREINERYPGLRTIIVTVHAATARTAVEAIRLGAVDYLVMSRTFPDELRSAVRRAQEMIREDATRASQGGHDLGFGPIVGTTPAMKEALELMRRAIDTPAMPVLILGEPGTGKELFAKTIHQHDSERCKQAFVPVKCGAIEAEELRFELLGGVRTVDSQTQHFPGVFNTAEGGTVFLDEIDAISQKMQVGLTRLLREGLITPLGEGEPTPADIRIIGASHNDVEALVSRSVFRAELYSALSITTIRLPSLRERSEDLPHIARQLLSEVGGKEFTVDPGALSTLAGRSFPDNIRGLRALLQRATLLADDKTVTEAVVQRAIQAGPAVSV